MNETCEICRFHIRIDQTCRFNPPTDENNWPAVSPWQWCGKWKDRKMEERTKGKK